MSFHFWVACDKANVQTRGSILATIAQVHVLIKYIKSTMTMTMEWPFDGQKISVTVEKVSDLPGFVLSDKFHFIEINGERAQMVAKTNKDEFYNDLTLQVSFVASKGFTLQNFFDGILYASIAHVKKFKRIYLNDLWSYINASMFIMEATKGQFHNLYTTHAEAIELRTNLEVNARHSLREYLLLGKEKPIPVNSVDFILKSRK